MFGATSKRERERAADGANVHVLALRNFIKPQKFLGIRGVERHVCNNFFRRKRQLFVAHI